jgi:hypothetical protein
MSPNLNCLLVSTWVASVARYEAAVTLEGSPLLFRTVAVALRKFW